MADLPWPGAIQEGFGELNSVITGIAWCFILGISMSALNVIGAAASLLLGLRRSTAIANWILAIVCTISLLIGALVATIFSTGSYSFITNIGMPIGIAAEYGSAFVALSWTAVAFGFASSIFWLVEFCIACSKANMTSPDNITEITELVLREMAKTGKAGGEESNTAWSLQ